MYAFFYNLNVHIYTMIYAPNHPRIDAILNVYMSMLTNPPPCYEHMYTYRIRNAFLFTY